MENVDKLLADGGIEAEPGPNEATTKAKDASERGMNFTKASCALDASVKSYFYHVDDAHLTTFQVLVYLNRTDS